METARSEREPIGARFHALALLVVLPSVLLWSDALAYHRIRRDLSLQLSSCPSLGGFLDGRPKLRGAIVVAEPDYLVGALPYYAPAQGIWVPLILVAPSGGARWGTTVFGGGMFASTLLNLFFIPILYLLIATARERRRARVRA